MVLTLGYAGTRSQHILVSQLNENIIVAPARCGNVPGYTLGLRHPAIPRALMPSPFRLSTPTTASAHARYDSLQVKAETKSVRHGLYALIGYTWSRNFDTGLPDGLGTNPGALYYPLPGTQRLDWGFLSSTSMTVSPPASFTICHLARASTSAATGTAPPTPLLGHWQVNVIERATSGFPLFVVDSTDPSGVFFNYNGLTVQRPNEVGDPNVPGRWPRIPTAYAPPTRYTRFSTGLIPVPLKASSTSGADYGELGTAARAPVYGPRFVNTDFSICQGFPVRLPRRNGPSVPRRVLQSVQPSAVLAAWYQRHRRARHQYALQLRRDQQTVNNPRLVQFALKLQF